MANDRQQREAVIQAAIKRTQGVEKVAFDEDGEHVYVGPVERDGEQVAERYRLGTDAQQFLAGEFPLDQADDLPEVTLHPPGGEG